MRDVSEKMVVTGASGALGGALLRHLAAGGASVTGISRQAAPLGLPDGADWRQSAGLDPLGWYRDIDAGATLLHAAGPSGALPVPADPDALAAPHLAMARALRDHGWAGTLILLSSAAVYGEPQALPVPETAPLRPLGPYGGYKLAVEAGLAEIGPRLVVLRLSNVYGTALDLARNRVAALVLAALRQGRPFTTYGDGASLRDYVYIDDFCRAAALAATAPPGAVVNIGSGQGTPLNTLIEAAEAVTGLRLIRQQAPPRAEPASSVLDIRQAEALLGWRPEVALDQGLRRLWATISA
jgi:nucleoside-diphosphate-sugar epimerase